MPTIRWTNPSVKGIIASGGSSNPFEWVEDAARTLALRAMEAGWQGPPFDTFKLASYLGIDIVARQDVDDARVFVESGRPVIEFNPQRSPGRIRFSIAHEIGHTLFPDYAARPRFRDKAKRRRDDWQLEVLCNVAAAEIIMPPGALAAARQDDLDLNFLLDTQQRLGVSTEALLRRVVRLSALPVAMFASARLSESFRIDYVVASSSWRPAVSAGDSVSDGVLPRCSAVGYSDRGTGEWKGEAVNIQAVGIPPYPSERFPRVVGLVQPVRSSGTRGAGIRYIRGDATIPRGGGSKLIAHVVNNKAQRWGPFGFAKLLGNRYPAAKKAFTESPLSGRQLGSVLVTRAPSDLMIANLVAQDGYGDNGGRSRLSVPSLDACLKRLGEVARDRRATVHMPLIGTGQGGMPWPVIRDLIVDRVVALGVEVTVYVLPEATMPEGSLTALGDERELLDDDPTPEAIK